jgi:hypothetical protein
MSANRDRRSCADWICADRISLRPVLPALRAGVGHALEAERALVPCRSRFNVSALENNVVYAVDHLRSQPSASASIPWNQPLQFVRHSGARPKAASPESIIPAGGYGFRARRHSASKTRVNALAAVPRNDAWYDSNLGNAVLVALKRSAAAADGQILISGPEVIVNILLPCFAFLSLPGSLSGRRVKLFVLLHLGRQVF